MAMTSQMHTSMRVHSSRTRAFGPVNPAFCKTSRHPLRSTAPVSPSVPAQAPCTTHALPPLAPLDSNYEKTHAFSDFANWLVPGHVMLGRYPYCEPSRCANDYDKGEQQLQQILEAGITCFASLQEEVPPQDKMTLAGVNGFLPYKATAELIKSSLSGPPPMEIVDGLRNPTLDKFLPKRKRTIPADKDPVKHERFVKPSYELSFLHHPIPDLSVPTNEAALHPFVDELVARLAKGEKVYLHCWGGRGRTGTVGACLLAVGWDVSAEEALERVQRAFDTRQDTTRSPETEEQHAFVHSFISHHLPKARAAAKA